MRYFIACLLLFLHFYTQGQSVKWHYDLKDVSFGQSMAMDIDHDGKMELVFSTYWNDSNVYVLNAENGTLKWKHPQPGPSGGCNDAGPLIFDPFKNGNYKIIVPGSCMDTTFCYDADSGYVQWKVQTGGGDSPPTVADIDNDGELEVLHGTFDGHVVCLNGKTGAIKWKLLIDTNAAIESEPLILDANNDGLPDFVVGTWDMAHYNSTTQHYDSNFVACYNGQTHMLIWKQWTGDIVYHGAACGDIDRDGKPEVTFGDYCGYVYNCNAENGSLNWRATGYYYVGAPTTLADLDGDHYLDIIYCDAYSVTALRHDSSLLWKYTIPGYATAFRGVAVADINNDNNPDVTFGTSSGQVISLDGLTGATLRYFRLDSVMNDTFEIDNAPIIADFDLDGVLDLFIVGGKTRYPNTVIDYGRAYCLSWGIGHGPEWTMFRHDEHRTACLCDTSGLPLKVAEEKNASLVIIPNPFNTYIQLRISQSGLLNLYNIVGLKVFECELGQGNNNIDLSSLNQGMYIANVILNNGEQLNQKIIKQ